MRRLGSDAALGVYTEYRDIANNIVQVFRKHGVSGGTASGGSRLTRSGMRVCALSGSLAVFLEIRYRVTPFWTLVDCMID